MTFHFISTFFYPLCSVTNKRKYSMEEVLLHQSSESYDSQLHWNHHVNQHLYSSGQRNGTQQEVKIHYACHCSCCNWQKVTSWVNRLKWIWTVKITIKHVAITIFKLWLNGGISESVSEPVGYSVSQQKYQLNKCLLKFHRHLACWNGLEIYPWKLKIALEHFMCTVLEALR